MTTETLNDAYNAGYQEGQTKLLQFAGKILKLRSHQKEYFKTRSLEILGECRRLEQIIDKEILAIIADGQKDLFSNSSPRKYPTYDE